MEENRAKLQNTGPLLSMHQTSRLVWLGSGYQFASFALTKFIADSYALNVHLRWLVWLVCSAVDLSDAWHYFVFEKTNISLCN